MRRTASSTTRQAPWITAADVDFYLAGFSRTGFRGGLNWYRNIDRNCELLAPFAGATVPAFCRIGAHDLTLALRGADKLVANLRRFVPLLRQTVMLSGGGHGTQQECPDEVNAAMLECLRGL